jgi:hypothetical protein
LKIISKKKKYFSQFGDEEEDAEGESEREDADGIPDLLQEVRAYRIA